MLSPNMLHEVPGVSKGVQLPEFKHLFVLVSLPTTQTLLAQTREPWHALSFPLHPAAPSQQRLW